MYISSKLRPRVPFISRVAYVFAIQQKTGREECPRAECSNSARGHSRPRTPELGQPPPIFGVSPDASPMRLGRCQLASPRFNFVVVKNRKSVNRRYPLFSPPAHRPSYLDPPRGGSFSDDIKGMDGNSQQRKKYDPSSYQTGSGAGPYPIRNLSGSSSERFRQQQQPEPAGGPGTDGVISQDRTSSVSAYGSYGYTESLPYNTPPLQGGTLQSGGIQYQSNFASTSARNQHPNQQQQRLSQYEGDMVYGITPQVQPESQYEGVSHYQPRHSAAIEVLATQFGVPQYFQEGGPAVAGGSDKYLTASQAQTTPYSQPAALPRASTASALPEIMAGLPASTASDGLEHSEFPRQSSGFDDAYIQYQRALRETFENTRSGRLLDASQSLLEISEWLLGNATELVLGQCLDLLEGNENTPAAGSSSRTTTSVAPR
ncbi:conserved hypothetical protein [Histoplasma capsulatum G186AR]|uniref:Uncharacterized protein n=1 Tax=Ajellomyces capsulatus (strain G186AR / H82 / ATCC MYA-2454 / RMSCC 2432) TaxID=447093 RepID=C0NZV9_AJECG|nr:uncharacterized protein HCBG_08689 [Histoplasma capsulatum G186AR]EEH03049.1 conserved hypothetical protein [Histoplasma capsulatum G186AR]